MRFSNSDLGIIRTVFGEQERKLHKKTLFNLQSLGAQPCGPRRSGPHYRASDAVFNNPRNIKAILKQMLPRIENSLQQSPGGQGRQKIVDRRRVVRATRYTKLIYDFWHFHKPASWIADEWNEHLPVGEMAWTTKRVEHLIAGLRHAAAGLRMNGHARTHGKRGRPRKYAGQLGPMSDYGTNDLGG